MSNLCKDLFEFQEIALFLKRESAYRHLNTLLSMKPFKSRKTLAKELEIHPRTLNRYMKALDIKWGREPMPFEVWNEVVHRLRCDDSPLKTGGGAGQTLQIPRVFSRY